MIASVQRDIAGRSRAAAGRFALAAGRLTAEKGFADAVAACASAGLPLVVAGDGPELPRLRAQAEGADVRFTGRIAAAELAALRREAALAIVPSRYAEILPLAALEAMAAGLPVVAAASGGLTEIVPAEGLYPAGDAAALAVRARALYGDEAAGERALAAVRDRCAPAAVAARLRAVYDGAPAAERRGAVTEVDAEVRELLDRAAASRPRRSSELTVEAVRADDLAVLDLCSGRPAELHSIADIEVERAGGHRCPCACTGHVPGSCIRCCSCTAAASCSAAPATTRRCGSWRWRAAA